jgi:hypothetical protein
LAALLSEEEATKLLVELSGSQLKAFTIFAQENVDAIEKVLMLDKYVHTTTSSAGGPVSPCKTSSTTSHHAAGMLQNNIKDTYNPAQQLLQQLIERHPNLFSTIMWQSPFLTAQIFHVRYCMYILYFEVVQPIWAFFLGVASFGWSYT